MSCSYLEFYVGYVRQIFILIVGFIHLYHFVVTHSWRVRLTKQETLTPPRASGLTSGLQGSVNIHRGALLLVQQWQCISSFVFYLVVTK